MLAVNAQARYFAQTLSEQLRVTVVLDQAIGHFVKRDETGSGQDAGLPEAAPQGFPPPARPSNKIVIPSQHRTNRRAQPFGQAEGHRIGSRHQLFHINGESGGRVEYPRAINVQDQPVSAGELPNLSSVFRGDRYAAGHVVRIFQRDQTRGRLVLVIRIDRLFEIAKAHGGVRLYRNRTWDETAELRHPALLIAKDVRCVADDDGFAALAVSEQGAKIALRAAGDKDGRLFAQFRRRLRFQLVHGRIIMINIIADRRLRHCRTHRRRRM